MFSARSLSGWMIGLLLSITVYWAPALASDGNWPKRTVKVIVPFKPGGGSDQLVRVMQKAMIDEDILPRRLTVVNMAGHYSVGARKARYANPDGYTFLVIHRALMGGQASGMIDYGYADFEPVAETSSFAQVLAVAADSPWQTVDELLAAAKASPGEIVFGCNVGALNHMAGVSIQQAEPGASFNYVQIGGGAANYAAILGGHIQVSVFGASEYVSFKGEKLRALGYTGQQGHPAISEVPTLKELGHDIVFEIGSWWFAPKRTPQVAIDGMADALEKAMQTEYVKTQLDHRALEGSFLRDEAFARKLANDWAQVQVLAPHMEVSANASTGIGGMVVPRALMATVALLCTLLGAQAVRRRLAMPGKKVETDAPTQDQAPPRPWAALTFMGLSLAYVAGLQTGMVRFAVLTSLFVAVVISVLLRFDRRCLWIGLPIALCVGFGCEYVFTEIFTIDLPTGGAK